MAFKLFLNYFRTTQYYTLGIHPFTTRCLTIFLDFDTFSLTTIKHSRLINMRRIQLTTSD